MKNNIPSYLNDLNSVSVESSLSIFRNCFGSLSYSFTDLTVEQLDTWIKPLEDPSLERLWVRQQGMKSPGFILYFAMWHFRNKTLQEQEYSREFQEKHRELDSNHDNVKEITSKIDQDFGELTPFEGVVFLGSLIGAWMLTCPKDTILRETGLPPNVKPNEAWLKAVFSDSLGKGISNEELELLYRLDYQLYLTFGDIEARNTS